MTEQPRQKEPHGPIAWFARNPVSAELLLVVMLAAGLVASNFVPVETFPAYDPGVVRIKVPYPGATPAAVERQVVKRLEEGLARTTGIGRVVASSHLGLAVIDVEIGRYADPAVTLNNVRSAVEQVEDFLPADAGQPEVIKVEISRSVLTLAVSSQELSPDALRGVAETLREALLPLPEIDSVELLGISDPEVRIEVDEEVLQRHRITLRDIAGAIRRARANTSGGELRTDSGRIFISTQVESGYVQDFAGTVVISRPDGTIVRLGDIAMLVDGLDGQNVRTTFNGAPAVLLRLQAASGASPEEAVAQVRARLARHPVPLGVKLEIWDDQSRTVAHSFSQVTQSGVFGLALLFLVLTLVFGERTAIWAGLGVLVVFVGSLTFFPVFGVTINVITLFAFFIMIGLVVDDSIIVVDSVARECAMGRFGWNAAVAGIRRVFWPIVVGALTTMIAFAVLLPLDGAIGQMFWALPVVAGLVLLASLLEVSLIMPGRLGRMRGPDSWPLSVLREKLRRFIGEPVMLWIVRMIAWSIRRPVWPPVIISALFLLAVGVLATGLVRWNPTLNVVDDRIVQADLTLPVEAGFDEVAGTAQRAVDAANRLNDAYGGNAIVATVVTIGRLMPLETYRGSAPPRRGENVASVMVRLNGSSGLDATKEEIRAGWRRLLANLPGEQTVSLPTRRTPLTSAVSYALTHADEAVLREATDWIRNELSRIPGVTGVTDSVRYGGRTIDIKLKAAGRAAGLSEADIASQLRDAFHGIEAQRIVRGQEQVGVMVGYPEERRLRYADLLDEWISLPNSRERIPLRTVAELSESPTRADRLRIDGRNAVIVNAELDSSESEAGRIIDHLHTKVFPLLSKIHPGLLVSSHGFSRDTERVGETLAVAVPVGVLLIYFLIASLLRSYLQPLLVLAGVPIAFIGAVAGHWILGYQVTITSAFGLVAAAGVVLNDAVLIMHRYNGLRDEVTGLPEIAAISAATRQRARPILLSTLTTVVSLLPILFSGDAGTIAFLIPLVVSLYFGLIFAAIGLPMLLPAALMITELVKYRLNVSSDLN
ncbi:MAG: efflux RND transporter permease subunit [Gammaproteobacteria bacterium]|nr:efflux RND transporter permease subunit [Gammaproteobacteria bacterium]MDE0273942.1 efflux RND transporter permease subunit [Gammaproteobacteria bacterium]